MSYQFYNIHGIEAAYIHISDICNFRCKICDLPESKKKEFVQMSEVKSKLQRATELGLKNIIFTGQEVMLHPHLDEIINYSFEGVDANYITFNTNGLAFSDELVMKKILSQNKYFDKLYLAVSVNFFNSKTFSDWSGHKEEFFDKWCRGFEVALRSDLKITVDIILKKDLDILGVLDFINKFNKKTGRVLEIRVLNLMPFGHVQGDVFKELKFSLLESREKIKSIIDYYKGRISFESFPICVHDQIDLKKEKYYIYNFHQKYNKETLVQYDPNIYETFHAGPTENWLIDTDKLSDAYERMFFHPSECAGCHYREICYGIENEYKKIFSEDIINKEIKKLKELNWK